MKIGGKINGNMAPQGPQGAFYDILEHFGKPKKHQNSGQPDRAQGPGPGTNGQGPRGSQWPGPKGSPMARAQGGPSGQGPRGAQWPGPMEDHWTGPRARDQWTGARARDHWTRAQGRIQAGSKPKWVWGFLVGVADHQSVAIFGEVSNWRIKSRQSKNKCFSKGL